MVVVVYYVYEIVKIVCILLVNNFVKSFYLLCFGLEIWMFNFGVLKVVW